MTLKNRKVRALIKVHVPAKFHHNSRKAVRELSS